MITDPTGKILLKRLDNGKISILQNINTAGTVNTARNVKIYFGLLFIEKKKQFWITLFLKLWTSVKENCLKGGFHETQT